MHLTVHRLLVDEASRAAKAAVPPPQRPPRRPREPRLGLGIRPALARVLAQAARRLDGESARRAVA